MSERNTEIIKMLAIQASHLMGQRDFVRAGTCLSFIHSAAQGIDISDEMLEQVGIRKKEQEVKP